MLALVAVVAISGVAAVAPVMAQETVQTEPTPRPLSAAELTEAQADTNAEQETEADAEQAPEAEAEAEGDAEQELEPLPHPELVLGSAIDGTTSGDTYARYSFRAPGPGLLTIVVRARGQRSDLSMQMFGPDGGELENGYCDIDFNGDAGAEHYTVLIPYEGVYRLEVQPLGSGGPFWIGASWIAYEGAKSAAPAMPTDAVDLTPGTEQSFNINGGNPGSGWFKYTADRDGFMIVETHSPGGADLVMELYDQASGFSEVDQLDYSDNDRRGDVSRERISVELEPGRTIFIKVRDWGDGIPAEVKVNTRMFVENAQAGDADDAAAPEAEGRE
jgi:hypothetical protein